MRENGIGIGSFRKRSTIRICESWRAFAALSITFVKNPKKFLMSADLVMFSFAGKTIRSSLTYRNRAVSLSYGRFWDFRSTATGLPPMLANTAISFYFLRHVSSIRNQNPARHVRKTERRSQRLRPQACTRSRKPSGLLRRVSRTSRRPRLLSRFHRCPPLGAQGVPCVGRHPKS